MNDVLTRRELHSNSLQFVSQNLSPVLRFCPAHILIRESERPDMIQFHQKRQQIVCDVKKVGNKRIGELDVVGERVNSGSIAPC